jgi:peroxiredoxin
MLLLGALVAAFALSRPTEGRHLSPLGVQEMKEVLVAPAFSLPNLSDHRVSLTGFRGKLVLLNFWATWCPPCVAEMPVLEKLHQDLGARGFAVVAVSIDTQGKKLVAPFWEKSGLTLPSLLDTSGEVATRYGVRALPTSFLINARGEIIGRILGPREWDSDQARTALRRLLNGAGD